MEKGFKGKSQVGWTEAYSKGYDAIDWGKTSEKNKEETKLVNKNKLEGSENSDPTLQLGYTENLTPFNISDQELSLDELDKKRQEAFARGGDSDPDFLRYNTVYIEKKSNILGNIAKDKENEPLLLDYTEENASEDKNSIIQEGHLTKSIGENQLGGFGKSAAQSNAEAWSKEINTDPVAKEDKKSDEDPVTKDASPETIEKKENWFNKIRKSKIGKVVIGAAAFLTVAGGLAFGLSRGDSENDKDTSDNNTDPKTEQSSTMENSSEIGSSFTIDPNAAGILKTENGALEQESTQNKKGNFYDENKESKYDFGSAIEEGDTNEETFANFLERINVDNITAVSAQAWYMGLPELNGMEYSEVESYVENMDDSGKQSFVDRLKDYMDNEYADQIVVENITSNYDSMYLIEDIENGDLDLAKATNLTPNGKMITLINKQGEKKHFRLPCGGQPVIILSDGTVIELPGKEIPASEVTPETPEVPIVPETPETPEVPETPETPEVPETPETPEVPETPEELTPKDPSKDININPDLNEEAVDTGGNHEVDTNEGNSQDEQQSIEEDNGQAEIPPVNNIDESTTSPDTETDGTVTDTSGETHEDALEEVGPAEEGVNKEVDDSVIQDLEESGAGGFEDENGQSTNQGNSGRVE
ncbi:hypothetical protein KBB73_00100 [Candidatus Saccharibacteria bacterium]|nr:hypothetical protein [Candidatus Saccharibacteria bacterium]